MESVSRVRLGALCGCRPALGCQNVSHMHQGEVGLELVKRRLAGRCSLEGNSRKKKDRKRKLSGNEKKADPIKL